MQQARSSFFNGLRTVSGSIFNMSPEYFVARYDRASVQQITDMIGWEAGKGKTFDVFKAPVLYPDNIVNEKKIFRDWLMIAKVKYIDLTMGQLLICFFERLSRFQCAARCHCSPRGVVAHLPMRRFGNLTAALLV